MRATNNAEMRVLSRTLAGATVLQIVRSLRDTPETRATVDVARALVQTGARAIVAGERGDLIDELKSFGGEWLPISGTRFSPPKLRNNADLLNQFVAAEGVDIIHAKNASAAWSARLAVSNNGIALITELPDLSRAYIRLAALYLGVLGRGDRVISHSMFNARPMIERHRIAIERVGIVPRSIDLTYFDPAKVTPARVAALRQAWGIPSGVRVVLVPGQVAPRNGQLTLIKVARTLLDNGITGVTFVLAGDDRRHRHFARKLLRRAQATGVDALFRIVGRVTDTVAAHAAADIIVVPYLEAPISDRVVAEAQAMARPVIASSVGSLPEIMLTPPRIAEQLRTGWEVPPGDSAELARTITMVLALDAAAYRAHAARAREFAESKFSPRRVAAVTLEIYSALLNANG